MTILEQIKTLLDNHNIEYKELHHDPTYTSEESAKARGETMTTGAKAIVYKIQDEFYLFVLAADRRLDPKKIKTLFNGMGMRVKKTRFASKEELLEQTGLVPGSVPPYGKPILPYDLYIDESLYQNEVISYNAGSLTDSITMSLDDYKKVSNGTLVNVT